MNNRITKISIMLIGVSLIFIIYLFFTTPMDKSIKNKNWYNYNTKTGNYDRILIKDNKIDINLNNNLKCNKYNYNNRNKTINFDCDLTIEIEDIKENQLKLKINNKEKNYFLSPEETLNYEFKTYYGETISEYENNHIQSKEIIKINYKEIQNILKNDKKSVLIFMGNKCTNIECTIILELIESWITHNENVYYIDSSEYNKFSKYLNNLNKTFDLEEDSYNSDFPVLYILDGKLTKEKLKCDGFDCSKWNNISKID